MHELHELTEGTDTNASLHEVHTAVVDERTPAAQVGCAVRKNPVSQLRSQLESGSIVVESAAQFDPNWPFTGCVTPLTSQVCNTHPVSVYGPLV